MLEKYVNFEKIFWYDQKSLREALRGVYLNCGFIKVKNRIGRTRKN